MLKNVLSSQFNYELNQCSPVLVDCQLVSKVDSDGKEYATFEAVDYPAIQAQHGFVTDWSLDSLIKAGINPNFSIKTGFNSRLDGLSQLDSALVFVDSLNSKDE